jgi:Domain of unknown function (DUF4188)
MGGPFQKNVDSDNISAHSQAASVHMGGRKLKPKGEEGDSDGNSQAYDRGDGGLVLRLSHWYAHQSRMENSQMVARIFVDGANVAGTSAQSNLGFLGGQLWFGRTILLLQYWRSFDALTRYAKHPDLAHLPAWSRFRRHVGDSVDVGIWHETYIISEEQYENIYHNMPAFGLGRVGRLVEATGHRESASQRVRLSSEPHPASKIEHQS